MIKKDIERGDIWLVNLDPSRKGELGKNNRPCIVIQTTEANKILPTVAIIPLSSKKQESEVEIKLTPDKTNNLKKISYVIWWHIYTVNKYNFNNKVGGVDNKSFDEIVENIKDTLGFSEVFEIM